MLEQENIKPYNDSERKGEQVERMFDQIAHSYDKLNHRLSLDIDKGWRRTAARRLVPFAPKSVLDVATGTADFAILLAKALRPDRLVGIDLSEGMMEIGRGKVRKERLDGIVSLQKGDCMELAFADNSFDAVTAAFGIRNFEDLKRGLREMCRVLKPGGHLCVVELTAPVAFPMKQLFMLYSHTFLPLYGRLVSKDDRAYGYLTATIEAFPQGEAMVGILKSAGFSEATFKRLTFGICTMYLAKK